MGGGMGYHLIHGGGAWFWFVFPAAAAIRIGWLVVQETARAQAAGMGGRSPKSLTILAFPNEP